MPRRTRSYGRPGTEVIPEGWGESHAPVAAATMTGVASLRVAGVTMEWSEERQRTVPTPLAPYATGVPIRAQAQRESGVERARQVVEQTVEITGYLITLPLDENGVDQVATGDLIDVTASDDPLLTGVTLRVTDLVRGTVRFERDVFAVVNDQTVQTTGGA